MSEVNIATSRTEDRRAFQRLYVAIAIVALTDVVLTTRILQLGGVELNHIANAVLQQMGVVGLAMLKLLSVLVVILCCQLIARRDDRKAARLAEWGVALNFFPVAVGFVQVLWALVFLM